eukprot:scaffold10682_cov111-Amphora_coffeaeformis.AAC.1
MHWVQQVKLYQKHMGNSSTFGDTEKLIHLQRAVATIPELRQIKTTADMLTATSGKPMDFDNYYTMSLLSTCASIRL